MPQNLRITVPRLGRNRHGVFFVRAPSFIDENGRRRVVQQSLRTKNPATAKLLALEFCLQAARGDSLSHDHRHGISPWTMNISTGEFSADGDDDTRNLLLALQRAFDLGLLKKACDQGLMTQLQIEQVSKALAQLPRNAAGIQPALGLGEPLQKLALLHLAKEAKSVESPQTVHEKKVVLDEFMEVFGADTGIKAITAQAISLRWIPAEHSRPNKKYKGRGLSRARLEKRRGYLHKFFTYAKESKFYDAENPMIVKMATKKEIKAETKKYAEFTTDDLAKLFKPDYVNYMTKPDWYWAPLLALFSGARLAELCQLRILSIDLLEGVKTYKILQAKTPDGKRTLVIHPNLIELGFWDYVAYLREQGETYLFPDRTSRKAVEKSVGLRWANWIKKCGMAGKQKVFHSFRSTVITDMHNASAGTAAILKSVGHSSGGVEGAHGDYVRGDLLLAVEDAIGALNYPTVDFSGLKLDDPTFSGYFEAMNAKRNSPGAVEGARKKVAHLAAKEARLSGTLGKAA